MAERHRHQARQFQKQKLQLWGKCSSLNDAVLRGSKLPSQTCLAVENNKNPALTGCLDGGKNIAIKPGSFKSGNCNYGGSVLH